MAQRHPILETESSSGTGRTDETIASETGHSQEARITGTSAGQVGTTSATTSHPKTHGAEQGVKGVLAGIHGLGEKVRGELNGAIDAVARDKEGIAKNRAVADVGDRERLTGNFAGETKNREGALPGSDHGKRY
ncbi:hypothetical protein BUE80_DR003823 [Diplocarpon rosae]|nr:hypothetical protein BUE80_DR003823 [Diplocarpon rosae]